MLSQDNNHKEALKHAKIAALMCEDNIIKTYYLYHQINENEQSANKKVGNERSFNTSEISHFEEKLKESEHIIISLFKKVNDIRKYNPEAKGEIKDKVYNYI